MFIKMKTYSLLFFAISFVASIGFANQRDTKPFFDRFEVQLNQKGNKIIVDKTILMNASIREYVLNLASYLKADESQFAPLTIGAETCAGAEYRGANADINKSVDKVLQWMKKSNLGVILADEKFISFVEAIDAVAQKFTNDPDYVIMANLDSGNYFFKRSLIKAFKAKLFDIAKKSFDSTPYLSLVNFIVDDYSNQLALKKIYHSNILSYYLENFTADQLGLTEQERARALSSTYDSKLSFGFGGFIVSKRIVSNFETYGYSQQEKTEKLSEKRWNDFEKIFDQRLAKIDSSFSEISYASSPMYFDLSNKQTAIDKRPSLSFDKNCPELMFEVRRRYELVRVGVDILPIPMAGKLFRPFKKSYRAQSLNEGSLFAYLESTHQDDVGAHIMKQSMNPLLLK